MSDDTMPITIVTGADAGMFMMAGMLATSLKAFEPDMAFKLLDFGLNDAQRGFAREMGWLVPPPDGLNVRQHPYLLKGSMGRYLADVDRAATIVWIDADIVCVATGLADLVRDMAARGEIFAAAYDAAMRDIAQFIATWPAPKLAEAVRQNRVDATKPYFNVGVVVIRDRGIFSRWQTLTEEFNVKGETCFEQNGFNVMAQDLGAEFRPLSPKSWNVHGPLLGECRATDETVHCGGERAMFLHATSMGERFHKKGNATLDVGNRRIVAPVKWFRDDALRSIQGGFLKVFVGNNAEALARHGLARPR